jgi:hypothetical protein
MSRRRWVLGRGPWTWTYMQGPPHPIPSPLHSFTTCSPYTVVPDQVIPQRRGGAPDCPTLGGITIAAAIRVNGCSLLIHKGRRVVIMQDVSRRNTRRARGRYSARHRGDKNWIREAPRPAISMHQISPIVIWR